MSCVKRRGVARALVLSASVLLAACEGSNFERVTQATSRLMFDGGPVYDPEEARALPYASMEVSFGVSRPSLVVLGFIEGRRLHWVTADRIVLVTEEGRLVQTAGFANDMRVTRQQLFPEEGSRRWVVDLEYRDLYGIEIRCRTVESVAEPLEIRGHGIDAVRSTEACQARGVDWDFENTFWSDRAGVIWKGIQHFSPEVPPLEFSIIKPAAI